MALPQYGVLLFASELLLLIDHVIAEKVHVVWSSIQRTPRFKSPTYLVCFVFVAGYIAVGIHLAYGM